MVSGRGLGDVAGWENSISPLVSLPLCLIRSIRRILLKPFCLLLFLLYSSSSARRLASVEMRSICAPSRPLCTMSHCGISAEVTKGGATEGRENEGDWTGWHQHECLSSNNKRYTVCSILNKIPLVICRNKLEKISEKEKEKKQLPGVFLPNSSSLLPSCCVEF